MNSRDRHHWTFRGRLALAVFLATLCSGQLSAGSSELTFEDRVRAQEVIERVYHSHRLETERPFERAVTRELLERKVRDYLERNAALERVWRQPVTAEALHREMERIAEQTKMPERLVELYDALGNDPLLIQECIARPSLVRRWTDSLLALDERVPASGKREPRASRHRRDDPVGSWSDWRNEMGPELDATPTTVEPPSSLVFPETVRRSVSVASAPGESPSPSPYLTNPDDVWDNGMLEEFVEASYPTTVWTGSEMIVWGGRLGSLGSRGTDRGARYDPLLGVWSATSLENAPDPRDGHSAVWTGTEMIVWGGLVWGYGDSNTGGRYDPVRDTWTPLSLDNAPPGRADHAAVWTGSEMIVWGGGRWGLSGTGGRYDPATDRWVELPIAGAPESRMKFSTVWTGTEMIVWGGQTSYFATSRLDSGAAYDPETDRWRPTSKSSSSPTARSEHTAVWTGSEMLLWGGYSRGYTAEATGSAYDPETDTWRVLRAWPGRARARHVAVWTGSEMLVFGWPYTSGDRYDPVHDRWRGMTDFDDPPRSMAETAVWTGSEMIVWGRGWGWRYRPGTNTWLPVPNPGDVDGRFGHTAVWTGSEMIVWGGRWSDTIPDHLPVRTGARYDPLLDNWTATSLIGAPSARSGHLAVWTGDEMIVWGGYGSWSLGARYSPVSDRWRPMSQPSGAEFRGSAAVWTGDEMIVWNGALTLGKRYDPAADTWTNMSSAGAPTGRSGHTAVWTGAEMIIWGGKATSFPRFSLNSGGRYNPQTNTWRATTLTDAPKGGSSRTAVWTGSEMIVWGGMYDYYDPGIGGHYDPVADRWSPTAVDGAPHVRTGHSAVWTGDEMIVWGGDAYSLDDGGRYDPAKKTWRATSRTDSARPRSGHTAVWTGREMIVWGGRANEAAQGGFYSGGSYLAARHVEPRGLGFWKHQCSDRGARQVGEDELRALFAKVNWRSPAFGSCSPDASCSVLQPGGGGKMKPKTERHLLPLWLNVVSGRVPEDVPIELSGLTEASTVEEAIADVEGVLCNPLARRSDLERARDVAEALNEGAEDMELAARVASPVLVDRGQGVTLTLDLANLGEGVRSYELQAMAAYPVELNPRRIEGLGSGDVVAVSARLDIPIEAGPHVLVRFVATDVTAPDGPRREAEVILKTREGGGASSTPLKEIQRSD